MLLGVSKLSSDQKNRAPDQPTAWKRRKNSQASSIVEKVSIKQIGQTLQNIKREKVTGIS